MFIHTNIGIETTTTTTDENEHHDYSVVIKAYEDLQSLLSQIIPKHMTCITTHMKTFFSSYTSISISSSSSLPSHVFSSSVSSSLSSSPPPNTQNKNENTTLKNTLSFEQHKQQWTMLAKQMIIDTENLDNAVEICRPLFYTSSTNMTTIPPYAETVAKEIFDVLDTHVNVCINKAKDFFQFHLDQVVLKCMVTYKSYVTDDDEKIPEKDDDPNGTPHDHTISNVPPVMANISSDLKVPLDKLIDTFFECFSELCTDVKPIIDVHVISYLGKKNPVKLLIKRFLTELCGIAKQISRNGTYYTNHTNTEIFDASSSSCTPSIEESEDSSKTSLDTSIRQLILSTVFQRICPILFTRMDTILRETDFDPSCLSMKDREKILTILTITSQRTFISFIEDKINLAVKIIHQYVRYLPEIPGPEIMKQQHHDSHEQQQQGQPQSSVSSVFHLTANTEFSVSKYVLEMIHICSNSIILTCLIFNESLP